MRFRLSLPHLTVFLKSPHCLLIYYSQDNRRVIVIFGMPLKDTNSDSNRKAAIQTGESDVRTRNKRYLWSALQKLMQHFSAFPSFRPLLLQNRSPANPSLLWKYKTPWNSLFNCSLFMNQIVFFMSTVSYYFNRFWNISFSMSDFAEAIVYSSVQTLLSKQIFLSNCWPKQSEWSWKIYLSLGM